jgi:hypothetical protein
MIGLLIALQVQGGNMDAPFDRMLPNRGANGLTAHGNFSRKSHIQGNQFHQSFSLPLTLRPGFQRGKAEKFAASGDIGGAVKSSRA